MLMLVLGSLSLSAQHNSFHFLGGSPATPSHATASNATDVVPIIGNPGTVELWVYIPTGEAGDHHFISQGGSAGVGIDDFAIGYKDGDNTKGIYLGGYWPDPNASMPIGQWTHIALAFDADFNAWLYINGVPVDSIKDGSYFSTNGGGSQLQLGTSVDSSLTFTGMIDGVRIWTVARTGDQIKAGMYGTVNPSDPDLKVWYQADEGSGSTSTNNTPTTGVDLVFQNGVGWFTGPAIESNNALAFDNTAATRVDIPTNAAYDFASGTIEAWVQPGSLSQPATFINNGNGATPAQTRYSFFLDNSFGRKDIGLFNGIDSAKISYTPGFTANNWYHVAFVTDFSSLESKDTTAVYVTGQYIGKLDYGYGATTGKPLTIGGSGADPNKYWTGGIDEVRIWDTVHDRTMVQAGIGASITGAERHLSGSWSFNQGIPGGDNTGLKVAVDDAPLTNNGLLTSSFALTSTASNFITYTPPTLPVTFGKFTVTKQGTSALLKWQTYQESNTRDFIIERSGNGATFTDIGSVAASGMSNTLKNYAFTDNDPLEGNNYYRILERDLDLKATYSVVKILGFTRSGSLIWYTTGAKSAEIRLQKGSSELYSITDVSGHVIRTGRLSDGRTTLSGVSGGIYFVKVINAAGNELNTKVLLQ